MMQPAERLAHCEARNRHLEERNGALEEEVRRLNKMLNHHMMLLQAKDAEIQSYTWQSAAAAGAVAGEAIPHAGQSEGGEREGVAGRKMVGSGVIRKRAPLLQDADVAASKRRRNKGGEQEMPDAEASERQKKHAKCPHDKHRSRCPDCTPKCVHGRIKARCTDCKGDSGLKTLCEHNRVRRHCKECGNEPKKRMRCRHDRQKHRCKDCGGSGRQASVKLV